MIVRPCNQSVDDQLGGLNNPPEGPFTFLNSSTQGVIKV